MYDPYSQFAQQALASQNAGLAAGLGAPGLGPAAFAAFGAPPGGLAFQHLGMAQQQPQVAQPPAVPGQDEQRTLYMTGFPTDTKERELNNLLRFMPGYQASQLNWRNGQASGRGGVAVAGGIPGGCARAAASANAAAACTLLCALLLPCLCPHLGIPAADTRE